jgi:tRNA A-37 threonylcarbamoyl transferase component Bud32
MITQLSSETGMMAEGRPPWWVLLIGAANLLYLVFACYVHITGPEPVGWMLQRPSGQRPEPAFPIASVESGSPAARAGLKPGDLLLQRDLQKFSNHEEVSRKYRFEVERADGGRDTVSVVLERRGLAIWLTASGAGLIETLLAAALNMLLAAVILFVRPRDAVARLGALMLAGMSSFNLWYGLGKPLGIVTAVRNLPAAAGAFLLIAPTLASLVPSILITFMAVFPRTTISRRWLWIFWIATLTGIPVPVYGVWALVYAPDLAFKEPRWLGPVFMIGAIIFCLTGACLLARNYLTLKDPNERRRLRVVVTGFLVTIASSVLLLATVVARKSPIQFQPFSTSTPLSWLLAPFSAAAPVCMAYAILRHRIFDIRIMIRQGLRYAAARGVLLSVVPIVAAVLAGDLMLHRSQPLENILRQRGLLYAVLAGGGFLLHIRRHVWLDALDRRFFRERYDAQRVLRAVVDEVREARSFQKVAPQVVSQVEAALHPEFTAILIRQPGEANYRVLAAGENALPPIPADSKLMTLMRVLGKPVEISQSQTGWLRNQLPQQESEFLRQARLEWLLPICLAEGQTEALLAMGPKRSEEPYSREDQELLEGITSSLALLLEQSPVLPAAPEGFEECPTCGTCYDTGSGSCRKEGSKLKFMSFPRLLAHRYRFEQRLGEGGMGTVYQALDTELLRQVAVKLIRSDLTASEEAAARFKQEARAAASFAHPNVVTVYDSGVAEDHRAYLIMELLRGLTLRKELSKNGRLPAVRASEILSGVCTAVDAAHRRRLLHRDLKPENIFLSNAEEVETAKILDFGVVKSIAAGDTTLTIGQTDPGVLVGTLKYMSPEQLRGEDPAKSWDLWALAVVAYEMLAGAYPFPGTTSLDVQNAVVAGRMIPLRTHLPEAPQSWQDFFDQALAASVESRPDSALRLYQEFKQSIQ